MVILQGALLLAAFEAKGIENQPRTLLTSWLHVRSFLLFANKK